MKVPFSASLCLPCDDGENTLKKLVKHFTSRISPVNWLPWIPQLLTGLVRTERNLIFEILTHNLLDFTRKLFALLCFFSSLLSSLLFSSLLFSSLLFYSLLFSTLYFTFSLDESTPREQQITSHVLFVTSFATWTGVSPCTCINWNCLHSCYIDRCSH